MMFEVTEIFDFSAPVNTVMEVWVTLPELPLELWNANCISKIASYIGIPVIIDPHSLSAKRLDFVRFKVIVDVACRRLDQIEMVLPNGDIFIQKKKYDFLPN